MSNGQWNDEQRQAEEGFGGAGRQLDRPRWRATTPTLALADRDTDPVRAQVLRHLAGAEWEHAALWHGRIVELGGAEPVYHGNPGGDADSLASRAGGVRMALRRLEIEESRAIAGYGEQLKIAGRPGIHRHP